MVSTFSQGGVSISGLAQQAQLLQSDYQWAVREPYDANCQQLHFVPHFIQTLEWNILRDGHWIFEIAKSVLQLFGQSKQPSWRWLQTFLLLQSCCMHWVPHATTCMQGTYLIGSSKGIEWSWEIYLRRVVIKWLAVKWRDTLVECHHSNDDSDIFNSYDGHLELQLSLYLADHTRYILHTIWVILCNGQYN